jgi:AraC-like DNA-binding protein
MGQASTVGSLQVHDAFDALHRLGIGERQLYAASGIDPDTLRDPDARLPNASVLGVFAAAERLTGDPFVGVHAGELVQPRGVLAYILMSSASLEQGMHSIARFSALGISTLRITTERHGSTASSIVDSGDPAFEDCHHAVDYLLMAYVRSVRLALGVGFELVEVHVRHMASGAAEALSRAFACPVRVGQPDNRVVYPLAELDAAPQLANVRVAEQIEKFAAAQLAHVAPQAMLSERTAVVMRQLLAAGLRPQSRTVARRLGLSERSLQRGLAEERRSFREVRDAVQWEVVEALLSDPRLKVETVALSVGFADVAAFSKSFKRWAGCPPAQYREQLAAGIARRR